MVLIDQMLFDQSYLIKHSLTELETRQPNEVIEIPSGDIKITKDVVKYVPYTLVPKIHRYSYFQSLSVGMIS